MTKKTGRSILKHAIRIETIYRDLDLFDSVTNKKITVSRISDKVVEIRLREETDNYNGQPVCIGC